MQRFYVTEYLAYVTQGPQVVPRSILFAIDLEAFPCLPDVAYCVIYPNAPAGSAMVSKQRGQELVSGRCCGDKCLQNTILVQSHGLQLLTTPHGQETERD